MTSTTLYFNDLATGGSSDKIYAIRIQKKDSGYLVNFEYGRRGGTLIADTKTPAPLPKEEAEKIYIKTVREKLSKGYHGAEAGTATILPPIESPSNSGNTKYPVELLEEVSQQSVDAMLRSTEYWLQAKIDGHRRQIEKTADGKFISYNRKGQPTGLPSEIVKQLSKLAAKSFLIDGELVGNSFVAFDILTLDGETLVKLPYIKRFDFLQETLSPQTDSFATIVPTWQMPNQKKVGYKALQDNCCEGAVFKRIDAPYRAGRTSHRKFKFTKTISCRISGVNWKSKDNATLSLLENGKWIEVGRASAIGKGKVATGDIWEVRFLYATEGRRLYQPRLLCKRDDMELSDCVVGQLQGKYKEGIEVV